MCNGLVLMYVMVGVVCNSEIDSGIADRAVLYFFLLLLSTG